MTKINESIGLSLQMKLFQTVEDVEGITYHFVTTSTTVPLNGIEIILTQKQFDQLPKDGGIIQ